MVGVQAPELTVTLARQGTHAPGRFDRLVTAVDGLAGPAALWYAGLGFVLLGAAHLFVWAAGPLPWGAVVPEIVPPAFLFAYFVWFVGVLKRVAGDSFDDFRPALHEGKHNAAAYRFALTSISDRQAVVSMIAAVVVIDVLYYTQVWPTLPPTSLAIEVATALLWSLGAAMGGVLLLLTVRQLRLVGRLSASADNVDIFKPNPINAFSRVTAVTATGILAFVVFFIVSNPTQPPPFVLQEALIVGLAVVSFVHPLRGMHRRLARQKAQLQDEAQDRLKRVLERLHVAVEASEYSQVEQLNNALRALQAEREVLAKLPTWPWSVGTLRGFATAVALPIGLFVITRLLDRFF